MEKTGSIFLSHSQKAFIVVAVLATTFLYSHYQKSLYEGFVNKAPSLILKEMPDFQALDVYSKELITKKTFLSKGKGTLVHFWGTWCAPCEAELPSFLKLAKELGEDDVTVLILAVNDEELAVKKFLKRFGKNRPKNVLFGLDKDGTSLPLYGSVKVPETYLFSNQLRHLDKFVGPQDWEHKSYKDRILRLLNATLAAKKKNVETH